ncbi:Nuclear hormone receptor, ligand-binding, core domain and Zinc finger, nuclear hormone receptor-type domain and Nuclear hormone receptor, ligand-binding domain and Zinc finger, NHR/GATA-type domain-containing protein [Strongyloides ratti]|uniref:Uncharacterized protein n=1 Tax=Strongyloides ratti TaxID=34506 RepID=A0A090LPZ8_STRRB|nr:Nuclear hormone receptor, ligand-binding, core domain and Zinc finger, nuclear hormone receptor-type domain and Nuclear hormone receptor, ligand-binding domain and Zinc finger, NHR/GATA-type domain-containing protein [Strongyloides ratti]CEF69626.1 Nuclear hormone receptor, ligand-binding, core domain and Zinc finger, nuclear hormone receptor-type domain and Nuclear hormone receptor, ligand-binding domain and Zinc finger, NHR/GATA-type domain-containing protein [Strongyloides ratti]
MKKNFCLICNNKTNGINNSINSCRACSVFFRRAILNHKNLQCRRGTNECVIKPGDKVFCKYCQFQKCINMGMIIKKNSKEMAINHDYNNLIEINNDNVKKINIFLQNETSTEKCDILIKENKVHIDMEELISYVNEIFSSTNSILSNYDSYTTSLQRIIIGIKNLFTNMNYNNPENIILTTKIDFKRCFQVWKNFIKHSPKLLMTLEEFSCLPLNDKKIIFSNFWKQAFILISGIYLTKIVALNDKSLILIDEIYVVDIKNIESIKFDIDIDNPKEILDLLTPTLVFFDNFILKQLKNEKYEDIEIMSTNVMDKNVCLVCNIETNSIHNSVNSCRACSAFFRRSIINNKTFRCRRGTNNCVMKPGDKFFCKYCRFKKCKAVGMVLRNDISDNFNNYILLPRMTENKEIESLSSLSDDSIYLRDDIKIEDNKILFDMKQINSYVNNIFLNINVQTDNNDKYLTCLQRVMKGLNNLNNNLNYNHPEKVIFTRHVELKRFIKAWQKFISYSPNLLMTLDEFVNLTLKDKWIIFKNFWRHAYVLITGIYITKINNPCSEALILNDDTYVAKLNEVEFINQEIDDKKIKETFYLMKPTLLLLHNFIHKPLKDEKYDEIEIAYLIVQMIFDKLTLHETANDCQKIGDEMLKVINDEIHNYYVYNRKMYNYAYRITEMTKLLLFIREFTNRQKEINFISKWMDLIDLSFMDSI